MFYLKKQKFSKIVVKTCASECQALLDAKEALRLRAVAVETYLPEGLTPEQATEAQTIAAEAAAAAAAAETLRVRAVAVEPYLPEGVVIIMQVIVKLSDDAEAIIFDI